MREASRGVVGLDMLDTSAHVLRLIDVDHESRVWWEIQRLSQSMSARGFDERDSAESSTLNSAKPLQLPDSSISGWPERAASSGRR